MSQENICREDLRPVTASQLEGRSRRRGKQLTVTDSDGSPVVGAVLGKAAYPHDAIVETFEGTWRMRADRGLEKVRVPTTVDASDRMSIRDEAGKTVAIARTGEVLLPWTEERFAWDQSNPPRTRYRLGGDLWVARGSWLRRRFVAELSPAILGRDDKCLLVGIASVLTQSVIEARRRLLSGAGGAGASWG
jgi:hypothetical protein